jgi:hypothetical protein
LKPLNQRYVSAKSAEPNIYRTDFSQPTHSKRRLSLRIGNNDSARSMTVRRFPHMGCREDLLAILARRSGATDADCQRTRQQFAPQSLTGSTATAAAAKASMANEPTKPRP